MPMTTEDIFMDLAIGATGSIIASIIVILLTNRTNKEKIRLKFSGPVGEYYGYAQTSEGSDTILIDKLISEVSITYESENKLLLTLKELNHPHQWSGIVAMETESYGTVSWRYDILHGKPLDITTHRFGFKRLMFLTKENKQIVYLVGEKGFGEEILIQKPKLKNEVSQNGK